MASAYHRYWRINFSAANGATSVIFGGCSMRTGAAGSNLCTGGTATASSTDGSPIANLFDNNPATAYGTAGSVVVWQATYDFGAGNLKSPTHYTVSSYGNSYPTYVPKNWTFEFSDDNTNWTVVHTVTNATGWGNSEVRVYSFIPLWVKNKLDYNIYKPLVTNGNKSIRSNNL